MVRLREPLLLYKILPIFCNPPGLVRNKDFTFGLIDIMNQTYVGILDFYEIIYIEMSILTIMQIVKRKSFAQCIFYTQSDAIVWNSSGLYVCFHFFFTIILLIYMIWLIFAFCACHKHQHEESKEGSKCSAEEGG